MKPALRLGRPLLPAEKFLLAILILVALISVYPLVHHTEAPRAAPAHAQRKQGTQARHPAPKQVPDLRPDVMTIVHEEVARVTASSAPLFAYAHGGASIDGRFFVGMADVNGNTFPTNEIVVFIDPADLSRFSLIRLPRPGDVETMVADDATGKVYFLLTGNHDLSLYALDSLTLGVTTVATTTAIDTGWRPAITTDGTYVYGITDATSTIPSTVFKVRIADGAIASSSVGHIPNGHSAAIGIYASSTELYFGGGMGNGFEKVDAATLASEGSIDLGPCSESNDMAYERTDATSGDVYTGCETVPFGYRVRTSDLKATRFTLPGRSYGLFAFGNDLYNTAQDGSLDVFPGFDLGRLDRYSVVNGSELDAHHQELELNGFFYSTTTQSVYFTAWWGVPGLYRLATSTE